MKSPAFAIAWEIWLRHRWGLILAGAGIVLMSGINLVFATKGQAAGLAAACGYAVLVSALFLTFGCFHFTEGQRKAGFGSFPARLFKMPVSTASLAALPMVYGCAAVLAVYLGAAWLIFAPLGLSLPKLWPCLYLAAALTTYQAIVWSFPAHRYFKLLLLSGAAMLISFCWMFFLPHMLEGTLSDWGIPWNPGRFQAGLGLALAAVGPAAYAFSLRRLNAQRHGPASRQVEWLSVFERSPELLRRGVKTLASPTAALFWLECRQTLWILPIAVAVVLAATCIPSYLSGPLSAKATAGLLAWLLIAPLVLAAMIGRGFAKPDFWSPQLSIVPLVGYRPITSGQFVFAKLKASLFSVALTWSLVLYVSALWLGHAGDLGELDQLLGTLQMHYPGKERWVVAAAVFLAMAGFTWRFMISGLAAGLSGNKHWFYASNTVTALILVALLACFIWIGDSSDHSLHLYNLWTVISLLPWTFAALVIAKLAGAAWAWNRAHRSGMISARSAAGYFAVWTLCSGILAASGFMAFANTPWLRNLVCLGSCLILPVAGPAFAMLAWTRNRTHETK